MFGVVQSPNFPEPYPREARLRWDLRVPAGFRMRLSFSHFDLEPSYLCEYDSVQVRGGATPPASSTRLNEGPSCPSKFSCGARTHAPTQANSI